MYHISCRSQLFAFGFFFLSISPENPKHVDALKFFDFCLLSLAYLFVFVRGQCAKIWIVRLSVAESWLRQINRIEVSICSAALCALMRVRFFFFGKRYQRSWAQLVTMSGYSLRIIFLRRTAAGYNTRAHAVMIGNRWVNKWGDCCRWKCFEHDVFMLTLWIVKLIVSVWNSARWLPTSIDVEAVSGDGFPIECWKMWWRANWLYCSSMINFKLLQSINL